MLQGMSAPRFALNQKGIDMAPRDRVVEILSIQQRGASPTPYDLERLRDEWNALSKSAGAITDFFPIRIVTLIEVFSLRWIARLIDHGPPFAERAVNLNVNIKFDLALAQSLHGRRITIGQLLAHSLSMQSIGALEAPFSVLLGQDLFQAISKTPGRRELGAAEDEPIIKDLEGMRKVLARLFEVRHILVHEFTRSTPYGLDEIEHFLHAAIQFVSATDEMLLTTLYGRYPITQRDMNAQAGSRAETARAELSDLVQRVAKSDGTETVFSVQKLWEAFKEAEANRQSEDWEGGSGRPLIYYSVEDRIIRRRVGELEEWLKESE
jgi:hypothetical protein